MQSLFFCVIAQAIQSFFNSSDELETKTACIFINVTLNKLNASLL